MKPIRIGGAALCAALAASASPIAAAPASGAVGTYASPNGTAQPANVGQLLGLENGSGALCLIGSDATCQLPGAGGGGGGSGGNVGGYSFQLSPSVAVQAAAYSAGNSEGGLITVTGAARTNGGSGALLNLRLRSAGGSTNSVWIYAWSKSPVSTCSDRNAFSWNAADGAYALPGFPLNLTLGGSPGSWDAATYAQASAAAGNPVNSAFKNQDSSPGTAIYFCIVTAGAVTPAATTDLSLVLTGYQD